MKKTKMNMKLNFESLLLLLFCTSLYYSMTSKGDNIFIASFTGCLFGGALWFFIASNWQMLLVVFLVSVFNTFLGSLIRLLYIYGQKIEPIQL